MGSTQYRVDDSWLTLLNVDYRSYTIESWWILVETIQLRVSDLHDINKRPRDALGTALLFLLPPSILCWDLYGVNLPGPRSGRAQLTADEASWGDKYFNGWVLEMSCQACAPLSWEYCQPNHTRVKLIPVNQPASIVVQNG